MILHRRREGTLIVFLPAIASVVLAPVTLSALADAAWAAPLGAPDTVARYELAADPGERPAYERENRLTVVSAEIRLGPVVEKNGRAFQWYGLSWTRLNGQPYEMWILVDRWPTADEDPDVMQYLWREPDWPDSVSFSHEVTGKPVLPRICLWTHGWPQDPRTGGGANRSPLSGTPEHILLQGWPFNRTGMTESASVQPPSECTTVKLNPELLVGWIAKDRDVDGRPHYRLADGNYRYQENTEDDLTAHACAGANFFTARPILEHLTRSHLFHSTQQGKCLDWPAGLYRSNYWGHRNHIDEPGVQILGADCRTPTEAVEQLQKAVRTALRREDGDRRTFMDAHIDSRFGRGGMSIVEDDYPTWEVFFDNAWYQLAVPGLGGIVDQDTKMFGHGRLVESYNMAFETQIPPTTENSCAIRVAIMRGAARNFNKKWGVGLYDPDGFKLRSSKVSCFYDKGATYFWTWTGWVGIRDGSGLPYPYQRQYFSLIRQAFAKNPNRDMQALLRAAKATVVIPYGYTFSPNHMNRMLRLHLERENDHGVTYRTVLAHAATEVERLLRMGIEFDIAVDDPLFNPEGYEELIYVLEDGRVRIVRPGHDDVLLKRPRPVERPDLGLGPRLTLEVVGPVPPAGGKVKLRATPELGTGDWHAEVPVPTINWEVYDAETIMPITAYAIFPVRGRELTFKVEREGKYVVRVAAADVFGRPAVAYKTIDVRPAAERP